MNFDQTPIIQDGNGNKIRVSHFFKQDAYGIVGLILRKFYEEMTDKLLIGDRTFDKRDLLGQTYFSDFENLNASASICSYFQLPLSYSTNGFPFELSCFNSESKPKLMGRPEIGNSVVGVFVDDEFKPFGVVKNIFVIFETKINGNLEKFRNLIGVDIGDIEDLMLSYAPLSGLMLYNCEKNMVGIIVGLSEEYLVLAPIDSLILSHELFFLDENDLQIHDVISNESRNSIGVGQNNFPLIDKQDPTYSHSALSEVENEAEELTEEA